MWLCGGQKVTEYTSCRKFWGKLLAWSRWEDARFIPRIFNWKENRNVSLMNSLSESTTRKTAQIGWEVARQGLWNPVLKLGSNPSSGTKIIGLLRWIPSIFPWASQPTAERGWIHLHNISRTFSLDGPRTQNTPINLRYSSACCGGGRVEELLWSIKKETDDY